MSAIARNRMKNWEVIADNLSKAGWSYGYVSAVDSQGRTIWIAEHIAMTESVLLCARMKSSLRFWSWNRQFALSVHKIQTNHRFRAQRLAEGMWFCGLDARRDRTL